MDFRIQNFDFRIKIGICTAISAIVIGLMANRFFKKRKQENYERQLKESLEKSRMERRTKNRPQNLTEDQKCVICINNPKEVSFYFFVYILHPFI